MHAIARSSSVRTSTSSSGSRDASMAFSSVAEICFTDPPGNVAIDLIVAVRELNRRVSLGLGLRMRLPAGGTRPRWRTAYGHALRRIFRVQPQGLGLSG